MLSEPALTRGGGSYEPSSVKRFPRDVSRRPVSCRGRHRCRSGAPDWIGRVGRRDHRLLLVALRAGMRSPETIALRRAGVHPGGGTHVRCHGKGRRERSVALRRDPLTAPRAWLSRG